MEFTRERLTVIIVCAIAIVTLGLYIFLYRPLINKCRQAGQECRSIELEVRQAHEAIGLLKQVATKRTLISEKDISLAMDELTKQGRSEGINFTSITPGKIEKSGDPGYKILPIDMQMESEYKALAVFLGSLEGLEKSLITVKSIDITSDKERLMILNTNLMLKVYLSGR